MAHQTLTFMLPEDERQFVRQLERFEFEVYPRRVPPDWTAFRINLSRFDDLPEDELYLVASDIGPAIVDRLKRGKDKGYWRIDEVQSPVIFWQRSRMNDDGELVSGQLWCELDVTPQTGRRQAAPDRLRNRFLEIDQWLKKNSHKSSPKGFVVGRHVARQVKQANLALREDKHFGREIAVYK
jgi:hypothetical protein